MQKKHTFSDEILKACDIRGIVGEELNEKDALFIGRSFGTALVRRNKKSCVVGYDGRLSSPGLTDSLISGLIECGIHVVNIGLVPTPAVYFALAHLEADAGIIVTASHNPAEYNGFKFLTQEGPFHGESLQEFAVMSAGGDFAAGEGSCREQDITDEYIDYLIGFLDLPFQKEISVVWDPGSGAAAAVLAPFLARLPGKHKTICGEVDGTFPHHHPDPSLPENMKHLQEAVKEAGADLGIAFDGDGDRIGVVDSEGVMLYGDQLLVIYARDFLQANPAEPVMSEVKASRFFYDEVKARGGKPVMWKVGHTNQKEKMKEESIQLAGETSGHIFFGENRGYDDALFASVKLLNILSESPLSLTDMRREFPNMYDSGEIRFSLDSAGRERLVTEIRERLAAEGRSFVDLDGIRADCADGFWMLRGSNTQPHITIRCEAATKEGLDACLKDMYGQLELSGIKAGE